MYFGFVIVIHYEGHCTIYDWNADRQSLVNIILIKGKMCEFVYSVICLFVFK